LFIVPIFRLLPGGLNPWIASGAGILVFKKSLLMACIFSVEILIPGCKPAKDGSFFPTMAEVGSSFSFTSEA